MISYISGTVIDLKDQAIIVDIGSIGLQVAVAQESAFAQGQAVKLHAYMHWNQEQGPTLFGFASELERTVFLMIISCSGLGPKIGLAALASLGPQRFLEVIQAGDERGLSKVSGIGPKKAEQMIVHLKHKVAKLLDSGVEITGSAQLTHWQNITQVLESLNYSRAEIAATMKHLRDTEPQTSAPFDHMMRRALSFLAKKS